MTDQNLFANAAALLVSVAQKLDKLGVVLGSACDPDQRAQAAQELDLQRQLLLAAAQVLAEPDPALQWQVAQALPLELARAALCRQSAPLPSDEIEFF